MNLWASIQSILRRMSSKHVHKSKPNIYLEKVKERNEHAHSWIAISCHCLIRLKCDLNVLVLHPCEMWIWRFRDVVIWLKVHARQCTIYVHTVSLQISRHKNNSETNCFGLDLQFLNYFNPNWTFRRWDLWTFKQWVFV